MEGRLLKYSKKCRQLFMFGSLRLISRNKQQKGVNLELWYCIQFKNKIKMVSFLILNF